MPTELEKLQLQIQELQRKAAEVSDKEKAEAIEDINHKIHLYDIDPSELDFPGIRKVGPSKVVIKYRLRGNQWLGRGRQPKWVAEHLAKGGKLEDLLVKS